MTRRLEYLPLNEIAGAERNAKSHSDDLINESITRFGFVEPIVRDERTGRLVAGHGRRDQLLAMRDRGSKPPDGIEERDGEWLIPVVVGWASENDREAEAAGVALNRVGEKGGWDDQILYDILSTQDDLSGLGFDEDDLADLLASNGAGAGVDGDPDDVPELPTRTITEPGGVWRLGPHRLVCGDSTDEQVIGVALDGRKASLLVTDPPYGVSYADKNRFLNAIGRPNSVEEPILGDHSTPLEVRELWDAAWVAARQHLVGGSCYYVTGPQGGDLLLLLLQSLAVNGFPLRHMLIWSKNNFVLGRSDYNYKHEPIIYGWVDGAGHKFYGEAGESSVWEIDKPHASKLHPTMKPVELYRRAIRNSSKPGDLVLDPFAGSGTLVIAAHLEGREAGMVEKDPAYCDVIARRWQEATANVPIDDSTGEPHDFTLDV